MANKFAFKGGNASDVSFNTNNMIMIGKVTSITDANDMGRIKARVKGVDDIIGDDNQLPVAFPLMPKYLGVTPKVGESVLIFRLSNDKKYDNRLYIGPIISQPQKLGNDPHFLSALAGLSIGEVDPDTAPSTLPAAEGIYPKQENISIQGRDNTDIVFKDGEVLIRAGKYELNERLKFNKENPAYIQIKNNATLKKGESEAEDEKGTVTNIVANKINLLTHKDGQPRFKLSNQESLITDDEMAEIIKKSHPLVFGDRLVDYLKLQRSAFVNHVHPYHGKKPQDLAGANDIDKYLEYDLDSLLSKNININ